MPMPRYGREKPARYRRRSHPSVGDPAPARGHHPTHQTAGTGRTRARVSSALEHRREARQRVVELGGGDRCETETGPPREVATRCGAGSEQHARVEAAFEERLDVVSGREPRGGVEEE